MQVIGELVLRHLKAVGILPLVALMAAVTILRLETGNASA